MSTSFEAGLDAAAVSASGALVEVLGLDEQNREAVQQRIAERMAQLDPRARIDAVAHLSHVALDFMGQDFVVAPVAEAHPVEVEAEPVEEPKTVNRPLLSESTLDTFLTSLANGEIPLASEPRRPEAPKKPPYKERSQVPAEMRNFLIESLPTDMNDFLLTVGPQAAGILVDRLLQYYLNVVPAADRDEALVRARYVADYTGLFSTEMTFADIGRRYVKYGSQISKAIQAVQDMLVMNLKDEDCDVLFEAAQKQLIPKTSIADALLN